MYVSNWFNLSWHFLNLHRTDARLFQYWKFYKTNKKDKKIKYVKVWSFRHFMTIIDDFSIKAGYSSSSRSMKHMIRGSMIGLLNEKIRKAGHLNILEQIMAWSIFFEECLSFCRTKGITRHKKVLSLFRNLWVSN